MDRPTYIIVMLSKLKEARALFTDTMNPQIVCAILDRGEFKGARSP